MNRASCPTAEQTTVLVANIAFTEKTAIEVHNTYLIIQECVFYFIRGTGMSKILVGTSLRSGNYLSPILCLTDLQFRNQLAAYTCF